MCPFEITPFSPSSSSVIESHNGVVVESLNERLTFDLLSTRFAPASVDFGWGSVQCHRPGLIESDLPLWRNDGLGYDDL